MAIHGVGLIWCPDQAGYCHEHHQNGEYKADCAIFTNHLSCKSLQPIVQLLREALREELGIPLLSIDIDVGDKRVSPFRTIKKEIDTFLKTLF